MILCLSVDNLFADAPLGEENYWDKEIEVRRMARELYFRLNPGAPVPTPASALIMMRVLGSISVLLLLWAGVGVWGGGRRLVMAAEAAEAYQRAAWWVIVMAACVAGQALLYGIHEELVWRKLIWFEHTLVWLGVGMGITWAMALMVWGWKVGGGRILAGVVTAGHVMLMVLAGVLAVAMMMVDLIFGRGQGVILGMSGLCLLVIGGVSAVLLIRAWLVPREI